MRPLRGIGMPAKRVKMGTLFNGYNRPLDFGGSHTVSLGRYCMSFPGLLMFSKLTQPIGCGRDRSGYNRLR
jgi:hypothetical protein